MNTITNFTMNYIVSTIALHRTYFFNNNGYVYQIRPLFQADLVAFRKKAVTPNNWTKLKRTRVHTNSSSVEAPLH